MFKNVSMAIAAAALISCGGGWKDPTTGNFSAQDSADVMGVLSQAFGAVNGSQGQPQPPVQPEASQTTTINVSQSCPVSGSVAVNGSFTADCNASTCSSYSGELAVSLTQCATQNGLVGDGSLQITMSGTQSSITETIIGAISASRTGGGLIGVCGINVTMSVTTGSGGTTVHMSGHVCGHDFNG